MKVSVASLCIDHPVSHYNYMDFLSKHNLITPDQSPFLKYHSKQTALHKTRQDKTRQDFIADSTVHKINKIKYNTIQYTIQTGSQKYTFTLKKHWRISSRVQLPDSIVIR